MKKRKGFTLVEIMIVVVIIGVLSALAIPRFTRATKKSKISEARIMLKTIFEAAQDYYAMKGEYPAGFWFFNIASTKNTNWNKYTDLKVDRPSGYPRFTYVLTPRWIGGRWHFRAAAWGYSPDSYDKHMVKVHDLHISEDGVITGGTEKTW